MKAIELRIGNMVLTDHEEMVMDVLCDSINTLTKECLPIGDLEPIEINEWWLLKFGFVKKTNQYWLEKELKTGGHLLVSKNGVVELVVNNYSIVLRHIDAVHQLQNLYHSLTGEELKL